MLEEEEEEEEVVLVVEAGTSLKPFCTVRLLDTCSLLPVVPGAMVATVAPRRRNTPDLTALVRCAGVLEEEEEEEEVVVSAVVVGGGFGLVGTVSLGRPLLNCLTIPPAVGVGTTLGVLDSIPDFPELLDSASNCLAAVGLSALADVVGLASTDCLCVLLLDVGRDCFEEVPPLEEDDPLCCCTKGLPTLKDTGLLTAAF